jgi:serine/threonine-protein phosphatase 6 regulatory ankyrin repeat subunit A/serine/threonine-protein phosphatase 6 regulatory ankyrin repeat subunit B
MEKTKLVDKSWVDVGKVFEKITPTPGFFKYRQTDETLYEAEGSLKNAFELSEELKQNEADRVTIQALIEENDWNQLFFILIRRRTKLLKSLAEIVKVDAVDENQQTILHLATEYKEENLINILLERKAEINAKNSDLETPLMIATNLELYNSVKSFLRNGADPNMKDRRGRTSLHFATNHDRSDLIQILLDNGAEIDVANTDGTPLIVAVKKGYTSSMDLLLTSGANVNLKRWDGKSALHLAAYYNYKRDADKIHKLVSFKAKVDEVDDNLETPLISAAQGLLGNNGGVEALLAYGADPNHQNRHKQTALHFATEGNRIDAVKALLTMDAKIDAISDRLETPLMVAAQKGR